MNNRCDGVRQRDSRQLPRVKDRSNVGGQPSDIEAAGSKWMASLRRKQEMARMTRPKLDALSNQQNEQLQKNPYGIFISHSEQTVKVLPLENPMPGTSVGFAGVFNEVVAERNL